MTTHPLTTTIRRHAARRLAGAAAVLLALVAGLPLPAAAQSRWTVCADDGQVCRFGGDGLVRYGVPGQWAFRQAHDRLVCDSVEFGDPAPGRRKQCEVSTNWRDDERYRNWREGEGRRDGGWRFCAMENDECHVNGRANVRFGAEGRYQVRPVNGNVRCDLPTFGDPAPGVTKRCEVEVGEPWGEAGRGPGEAQAARWQRCAIEGGACRFDGPGLLRYGTEGHYMYLESNGPRPCNNESFGYDPSPGRGKQCDLIRLAR